MPNELAYLLLTLTWFGAQAPTSAQPKLTSRFDHRAGPKFGPEGPRSIARGILPLVERTQNQNTAAEGHKCE
jgi:hypothetical protein